jgi:hypothetical protein
MKPFNLQQALAGAPVVTRDGRKVEELHYFKNVTKGDFPIVGVIDGRLESFTESGNFNVSNISESDLFMAPVKVKMLAQMYFDQTGRVHPHVWRADQSNQFSPETRMLGEPVEYEVEE